MIRETLSTVSWERPVREPGDAPQFDRVLARSVEHFRVMSVLILATTVSPSDAFGVRFTATMSPDLYPTEDMLSPRTTT